MKHSTSKKKKKKKNPQQLYFNIKLLKQQSRSHTHCKGWWDSGVLTDKENLAFTHTAFNPA